jgi:hypothetical protein
VPSDRGVIIAHFGGSQGAYQIPHAHAFRFTSPDKGRASFFVELVGEGKPPPTLVTRERGAPLLVAIFFATEKDQSPSAPTLDHDAVRANDEEF